MRASAAFAGLLAALVLTSSARAQHADADTLFARGRLDEAGAAYAQRLARAADDRTARERLGLISLWKNDLRAADMLLGAVLQADPNDREARAALAEVFYRQNRFADAARELRVLGRQPAAAKLEAIGSAHAARVPGGGVTIPFLGQSVLPVLEVAVNGQSAHMLLDTGGGETILDPAFADRVGARRFGADSGSFAGGRVGAFEHGSVGRGVRPPRPACSRRWA